jgi:hypothetical protein
MIWCDASGNSYSVGRAGTDAGHDGNQNMLFNVERARVERNAEDLVTGDRASP